MKAAPFNYHRARSLEEASELLSRQTCYGKLLAGGQSLGPMMNMRLVRPDFIVDLCGVDSLKDAIVRGGAVELGAGITHSQIEDGIVSGLTGRFLSEVAHRIAYRAVRNYGTVGGSIAHADPAADWVSALIALGAELVIWGEIVLSNLNSGD